MVDVGCGIGGSTRYLARKYGATCVGFAISPAQVQRAQALTASQGLADKVCEFITSFVIIHFCAFQFYVQIGGASLGSKLFFVVNRAIMVITDNIKRRRNKKNIMHIFYVIQPGFYIHGNDSSKFYYH